MQAIVRSEELSNGYVIVIQDQHEYHGKIYNARMILPLPFGKKIFISGEDIIKYKVIVLNSAEDNSIGRKRLMYGIMTDTNCHTIDEAHQQVDKYIEEYESK